MNASPANSVLDQVLGDLDAESAALEAMVAPLDESGWRTPTPAARLGHRDPDRPPRVD